MANDECSSRICAKLAAALSAVTKRTVKMRSHLLATITLLSHAFAQDASSEAGLFKLGSEHVYLVAGSISADGRYAAGCTVRPKKGQPPVKWETFGKEDGVHLADYDEDPNSPLVNVIVDLQRHEVVATLKFTTPYFPGKNHGAFHVVFGPEQNGHRFALAVSGGKWEPNDLVAVELGPESATQTEVLKALRAAVDKSLRTKVRSTAERYVHDFWLHSIPETGLVTGFAGAGSVRVPFVSQIPKSESAPTFEGTVLLRLSSTKSGPKVDVGEVILQKDDSREPDPTQDDPRLAAADKELNTAYAALRAKLSAPARKELQDEQRAWIADRDQKVQEAGSAGMKLVSPRHVADHLLLKLTTERTAILRAR